METRLEARENGIIQLKEAVRENKIQCSPSGSGGLTTVDTVEYITGEVTAGGKIDLFEPISESISRVGLNSFDGRRYNSLGNSVIDAVTVEAAVTTSETATAATLVFDDEMDVAILNSNIIFSAGGKVLFKLPMKEVHNPNTTRLNDEKYRSIGHLPIIEAEKDLKCEIEFPTGVVPDNTGGKRHLLKVSIRVTKTLPR